jgi:hypothetical protein
MILPQDRFFIQIIAKGGVDIEVFQKSDPPHKPKEERHDGH